MQQNKIFIMIIIMIQYVCISSFMLCSFGTSTEASAPAVLSYSLVLSSNFIVVVFNVGEYRRGAVGANKTHDFFHPENKEAQKQRK